jgi:hypothetical protein
MRDAAVVARHLFAGLPADQRDAMLKLLADVEADDGTVCGNIAAFLFRWCEEDAHAVGIAAEFWSRFHNALADLRSKP